MLVKSYPGGRNREGRNILTIPAGKTENLSVDQLGDTLSYLTQSPRYVELFKLSMLLMDSFTKLLF